MRNGHQEAQEARRLSCESCALSRVKKQLKRGRRMKITAATIIALLFGSNAIVWAATLHVDINNATPFAP